jgi:phthiocerol/phenolphthiocerol synthesis type-I polyketide synthase E
MTTTQTTLETALDNNSIAIVAMACRVPGASNVEQLWRNLSAGIDSIERWTSEEDGRRGSSRGTADPRWVRACAFAEDIENFDARFFGYTPAEATLLDPQQRMFLECCWQALESAGHIVPRSDTLVGVYGGAALSSYLLLHVAPYAARRDLDPLQLNLGNAESFLTTRVSYKLDLRGPSYSVTSACSTSLVAVHLACQALLSRECDVALAGGVSINLSLRDGYRFIEGSVLSPDGRCRPFDADAQGIVFGSGAGVVALRRLTDAIADGDLIHAVIRGSATNNDGGNRVGYTAPSVDGQAEVIAEALANAQVSPSAIGYIEAHGTGTRMGDPIELRALAKAFGAADARPRCAIGSIKSNLGHLDAAAGVLGLIKAALMVERGVLVPSIGCDTPNPAIDWVGQGFQVQRERAPWPAQRERIAGVSAFGMGGTNAHVVVSEPPLAPTSAAATTPQLLVLSAKSDLALDQLQLALAAQLAVPGRGGSDDSLEDIAFTLACTRRRFDHRLALVVDDLEHAVGALRDGAVSRRHDAHSDRPVVFMFPGQGSQFPGMAEGLYRSQPAFRDAFDRCATLLKPHLEVSLSSLVFAAAGSASADVAARLAQTEYVQPALFAVEYALAQLWMAWGVRPAVMIGHSVGELVAATLAGVFRLEDALALVVLRGALMGRMPRGKMLSVSLPEAELATWLGPDLELAAVNAPGLCVVAGTEPSISGLAARLTEQGITHRALHTSHAFHSRMMQEAADAFVAQVAKVQRRTPNLPFASNVTGKRVTAAQATDPAYWGQHLRSTVRFADGLADVTGQLDAILLEVGPGRTLCTFARAAGDLVATQSLAEAKAVRDDVHQWHHALAELWLAGASIDFDATYRTSGRRVRPMPTHPFIRQRYWIEREPSGGPLASAGLGPVASSTLEVASGESGAPATVTPGRHPRPSLSTRFVAPSSEDERRVAGLWEEVLGLAPVGIDDDFFDLGGHSLLATTLVGRLRELYQIDIPLQRLFEAPTVRGTAQVLADERAAISVLGDDDEKQELLRLLAEMSDDDVERELGATGHDRTASGGGEQT